MPSIVRPAEGQNCPMIFGNGKIFLYFCLKAESGVSINAEWIGQLGIAEP